MAVKKRTIDAEIKAPIACARNLRELCWTGCSPQHRATSWQILLNYLPTNSLKRSGTVKRKRAEYIEFANAASQGTGVASYYEACTNLAEGSVNAKESYMSYSADTFDNRFIARQVHLDVKRVCPEILLFRHPKIQACLMRALYCYAMRNPGVSYVQGFHDLISPFVAVFLQALCLPTFELEDLINASKLDIWRLIDSITDQELECVEADAFWCLSQFLSCWHDHHTEDQLGVQRMLLHLESLTQLSNPEVHSHFESLGVEYHHFGFRWMSCLLVREIPFLSVVRMWDTLLSEPAQDLEKFFVCVCAGVIDLYSHDLIKMQKFEEVLLFLQNMPTQNFKEIDVATILSQAFVFRAIILPMAPTPSLPPCDVCDTSISDCSVDENQQILVQTKRDDVDSWGTSSVLLFLFDHW